VNTSTCTNFTWTGTISGKDIFDLVFTNNGAGCGQDRNLYVDYLIVDGTTIQAEGGAAIIDRGWSNEAFDGQEMLLGGEGLAWSSALRFARGAGAFSGGYDANGNLTSRVVDGAGWILSRACLERSERTPRTA
jgi:hypothetical protein